MGLLGGRSDGWVWVLLTLLQEQTLYQLIQEMSTNVGYLVKVVCALCLSPFYYGYTLTYISTIPANILGAFFGQEASKSVIIGLLISLSFIGAGLGALSAVLIMPLLSRKNFLLLFNITALLVGLIIQINNLPLLFVCRVLQGFIVGNYMAITPMYISQLTPVELKGTLGSFSQFFNISAVVLCYALGLILEMTHTNEQFFWRFMFAFTQLTVSVQTILLLVNFIPESPRSLIEANRLREAKKVIQLFNSPDKVNEVFKEHIRLSSKNTIKIHRKVPPKEDREGDGEMELTSRAFSQPKLLVVSDQNQEINGQLPSVLMTPSFEKTVSRSSSFTIDFSLSESSTNREMDQDGNPLLKKKPVIPIKSLILGFELPLMQPLSGVKSIVTQIRLIVSVYNKEIAIFTPLIVNAVQLLGTGLSIAIFSKFGRRPIITIGNISIAVCDIFIAFFFLAYSYTDNEVLIFLAIVLILIFMIIYGMTIGPGVWLYVPEIVPSSIVPAATFMNWLGASLTVILTPVVIQKYQSAYPLFFVFAAVSTLFAVINWFLVVETKGLKSKEVIRKLL